MDGSPSHTHLRELSLQGSDNGRLLQVDQICHLGKGALIFSTFLWDLLGSVILAKSHQRES